MGLSDKLCAQVLKPEDYRRVMDTVQQAILSTDLEQYFKTKDQFRQIIKEGPPDWHDTHNKKRKSVSVTKDLRRRSTQL